MKDPRKKRNAAGPSEKEQFLLKGDPDEIQRIRDRAESLGISATAYLLNLAKTDIAKGGEFILVPKSGRGHYGAHTSQNFNEPDDGAATARPHEQSRAEEGKSPPAKRKAG